MLRTHSLTKFSSVLPDHERVLIMTLIHNLRFVSENPRSHKYTACKSAVIDTDLKI